MKRPMLLGAGLLLFLNAVASAEDASICYAGRSAFATLPPRGWHSDFDAGQQISTCVVYVLNGSTFDSSPAVLYPLLTSVSKRTANGTVDLGDFIAGDIATFRQREPKLSIETEPSFSTKAGLSFMVRDFINGPRPNEFEQVAYAATDDAVLTVTLSARTAADFRKFKPALKVFASSVDRVSRAALFPALKKSAERETSTRAGKSYESLFLKTLIPRLEQVMGRCSRPGDKGFAAVLQVERDGVLNEITFEKPDRLAECIKGALLGFKGPKPPAAAFHIPLTMSVKT